MNVLDLFSFYRNKIQSIIMLTANSLKNSKTGMPNTKTEIKTTSNHDEHQYLNLIKHVLSHGKKKNDRTGNIFGYLFMDHFPFDYINKVIYIYQGLHHKRGQGGGGHGLPNFF